MTRDGPKALAKETERRKNNSKCQPSRISARSANHSTESRGLTFRLLILHLLSSSPLTIPECEYLQQTIAEFGLVPLSAGLWLWGEILQSSDLPGTKGEKRHLKINLGLKLKK